MYLNTSAGNLFLKDINQENYTTFKVNLPHFS